MILTGALLLYSFGLADGQPISAVDSLFTATSAVCVTGLTVVDTSSLPFSSQLVVLILIQLGGLGVMTVVTASFLLTKQRVGHYQRLLFTSSMGVEGQSGAIRLVQWILAMVVLVESLGALLLWWPFSLQMSPGDAFWTALFHSISAFCNAGFSLFSDNLVGWENSGIIKGVVEALIVVGGLGFVVLLDVALRLRGQRRSLSIHTKLVLWTTGILIVCGTLLIWAGQWQSGLTLTENLGKLPNALFLSISSRTAGFNVTPMGTLSPLTIFVVYLLMLVGASPGSTGGGMKTTTLAILAVTSYKGATGASKITVERGTIPGETINRAVMLLSLYLTSVTLGIILLGFLEVRDLQLVIFDVISAMGTVGLSLSNTGEYSPAGKYVLILLMFWGRVGILTFIYGLLKGRVDESGITYPDASISIG